MLPLSPAQARSLSMRISPVWIIPLDIYHTISSNSKRVELTLSLPIHLLPPDSYAVAIPAGEFNYCEAVLGTRNGNRGSDLNATLGKISEQKRRHVWVSPGRVRSVRSRDVAVDDAGKPWGELRAKAKAEVNLSVPLRHHRSFYHLYLFEELLNMFSQDQYTRLFGRCRRNFFCWSTKTL